MDADVEDGEVLDSADEDYTPLERPCNYSAAMCQEQYRSNEPIGPAADSESNDDIAAQSSSSDSDSDSQNYRIKRPCHAYDIGKTKPQKNATRLPQPQSSTRVKRYDIWTSRAQEDVLAETLNTCDVSLRDRSRDVESYDHLAGRPRVRAKRSFGDRADLRLRLPARKNDECNESHDRPPRIIPDLQQQIDEEGDDYDNFDKLAKDIANKLCEEREDIIVKILQAIGSEKAREKFCEVQKIEAEGGMLIINQSRRRTPGGLYIHLVKQDPSLTKEQHELIFSEDRQKLKEIMKERKKKKSRLIIAEREKRLKNKHKDLPDMLSKGELHVVESIKECWKLKPLEVEDVTNPPPTPETEDVVSGEEMENGLNNVINKTSDCERDTHNNEMDTM